MDRQARVWRSPFALAFLIISLLLILLSWRSYQLAGRMERGIESFTIEYLHSAAEIAARRIDAQAVNELLQAAESWRNIERDFGLPEDADLKAWMDQYSWMISAIWVPDENVAFDTRFAGDTESTTSEEVSAGEFYTAGGAMSYTYDPGKLLERARGLTLLDVTEDDHPGGSPETQRIRRSSKVEIVPSSEGQSVGTDDQGEYSVTVPLAPPLKSRAVRASIDSTYLGEGWYSPRVNSVFLALIAVGLLFFAGYLFNRSMGDMREALQLREALVANVSHELRTPLSMMRLGIETLDREDQLDAEQRSEIRNAIRRETMLLSHLVENVLDVTRLDGKGVSVVKDEVDPADLIYSLLSDYSEWIRSQGFELEISVDETVEPQMWDQEAMSRALLNLIENAIKYSRDDRRLVVSLINESTQLRLSVRDHGVGLKSEELERIFDPYYRAEFSDTVSRRGAGLGLTLVREIVRAHGGRMSVESEPGHGSVFTMVLPRTDESESVEATDRFRSGKLGLEA